MSAATSSAKKRTREPDSTKSEKLKRVVLEDDLDDADISSDIKGIMSALQQIREKAQKDGQKKNEQTISSVASELKSSHDELKAKLEKERIAFAKSLSKSSKECETLLKNEAAKFQEIFEKFSKDKSLHLEAIKDGVAKYEEEKEKLFMRYEQLRKKEKSMLAEHEKGCSGRIGELEESLKKKKQDDKTFSILRKSLGSILDYASDEDFPPDN